jgi:Family of unknown function (DUF5946)
VSGDVAVRCVGCGALFPESDGPVHRYMESSPGCWAAYGEVLAREYGDPAYGTVHRLTVDAYAAQHPGRESPQTVQSVAVHLISLSLVLERGIDARRATSAIRDAVSRKGAFRWLPPPSPPGELTVADVLRAGNATEHVAAVEAWARAVWRAWSPHHDTVREWASNLL